MWGLQLAPLTGRLVAAVIAGERPDHDVYPLRPDRFRLWPSPRTEAPLDTLRDVEVAA